MKKAKRRSWLWLLLVVVFGFSVSMSPIQSDVSAATGAPQIWTDGGNIHLRWRGDIGRTPAGTAAIAGWPQVEFGDVEAPAWLIAVRVGDLGSSQPRIDHVVSTPYSARLAASRQQVPRDAAGRSRSALAITPKGSLPKAPASILRSGHLRGTQLAVIAISPIWQTSQGLQAATDLVATIPNATLLSDDDVVHMLDSSRPFLAAVPPPSSSTSSVLCAIHVTNVGIQRVTGAALAACGVDPNSLDPSRLRLMDRGSELALDVRPSGEKLGSAGEVRFYAGAVGDRWNAGTIYWLYKGSSLGLRMPSRDAMPAAAAVQTTVKERGIWRSPQGYDPIFPGPYGDHWYSVDLLTGPGQPAATKTLTITPTLPLVAGTTVLTVTGTAYSGAEHQLRIGLGTLSKTVSWHSTGLFTHTVTFDATAATDVHLQLIPGSAPDGLEIDTLFWDRPATPSFSGKGAAFGGVAGTWRYQLRGLPTARTLYDVSDPQRPQILRFPAGTTSQFQDGPGARRYILGGPSTVQTPMLVPPTRVDLVKPLQADVLYIAPREFHSVLAPLIKQRQAQGYKAQVIDVEAIYDTWSWGQVSPDAIRDFLRYAAATWPRAPRAVTLVGDGTIDPRNYLGRNNRTLIPPYLAMVDYGGGEAACDTCYAQLDGDHPVMSPDADAIPDLQLGRLPVNTAADLKGVINKLISYETTDLAGSWRSRNVYIADNYRDATGKIDDAGDFAALSEQSVGLQPSGVDIERLYYDPWKRDSAGLPLPDPWREPDAEQAYQRTHALLSAGAGLVNYTGHSHYWQWASNLTSPPATHPYLLSLYDVDSLQNGTHLPIVLELTCLTGAFAEPAYSATTIDERMIVKANGGAVAVWAPTGSGLVFGHDALQRGFYRALWAQTATPRNLGVLTAAGYLEVFKASPCCQNIIYTYTLFGDPLTPALVFATHRTYLPAIGH